MKYGFVRIIGGGLAGCEAALKLSDFGIRTEIWDIKPSEFSPAHSSPDFGELVCSNSLKSDKDLSASAMLKSEMRMLGSNILTIAESVSVPSGRALAVDRVRFSKEITNRIKNDKNITIRCDEYIALDDSVPTIIATGPLTTSGLFQSISASIGKELLYFFDAAAPIIDSSTVDFSKMFAKDRASKNCSSECLDGDYFNIPLNKQQYLQFVEMLVSAETVSLRGFEGAEVFDGCMPIEVMAKRGIDTLRFGMLKPVGLDDTAYACVQLRAENLERTAFNLVGFQTNLRIGEQIRVFRTLPGLEGAEFFRYGVMHRNSFLDAPRVLDGGLKLKGYENIYIAGQLSGVEGYVESMASGLICAYEIARKYCGLSYLEDKTNCTHSDKNRLSRFCMLGALLNKLSIATPNFQPVNANFGILPPIVGSFKTKDDKIRAMFERSKKFIQEYI